MILTSDLAFFYPCILLLPLEVLLVLIQYKSSEGLSASQLRPDLEPSPLPKLGLIHKRYSITLLVCKSTTLVANGSSNVRRVARSLVRRPVGAVRGTRAASLWISEGQNALRVEKVLQIYPERALCARVSILRGSVEENSCPEEQEAS